MMMMMMMDDDGSDDDNDGNDITSRFSMIVICTASFRITRTLPQ